MNSEDTINNLTYSIEVLKSEISDLRKSQTVIENNYKNCKRELKELKENFIKLKGTTVIF